MNPTKSQINPTKSIPRINSCLSHIWCLVPVLCRVRLPGPLWPGADLAGVPARSHPAVLWPWGQQRLVVSRVQRTEGIRACQLPWQDVLRVKIFYVANREHLRFGSLENIFVHRKKKKSELKELSIPHYEACHEVFRGSWNGRRTWRTVLSTFFLLQCCRVYIKYEVIY